MSSYLRLSAFVCGSLLLIGCKSTEGPSEARKTQDAALKDPFAYNPDTQSMQKPQEKEEVDRTNISGGGTGELDKKALKRDWDAIWGK